MKVPDLFEAEHVGETGKINAPIQKKVYSAPQLNAYGSLAELVQNSPCGGNDGV